MCEMKRNGRFVLTLAAVFAAAGILVFLSGLLRTVRADPSTLCVAPGGSGCAYSLCGNVCHASVQLAVDAAAGGDEILVATGTYTDVHARSGITQVVYISKTVTIRGGYSSDLTTWDPDVYSTTLDAQARGRALVISGTLTATIESLNITGGDATALGGYHGGSGRDVGGGVYVYAATVSISDCVIHSNTASTINQAYGGGLYLNSADATLTASTVQSNTAGPVTQASGGGLYAALGTITVSGSTVKGNIASGTQWGWGGGLNLSRSSVTLAGNIIRGNAASDSWSGSGGGLYAAVSDVLMDGNTVISNTATPNLALWGRGGGLYIDVSSSVTLTNNIVAHNHANIEGSGLYIGGMCMPYLPTSGHLVHNTIADNSPSGSKGQGVHVDDCTSVAFTNTIIAGHDHSGVYVIAGSTATLEATLWHGNGVDTISDGTIVTGTVNIHDDPTFVDPAGYDYHLAASSPAINAGVYAGVTTDIDGDSRLDVPDIGADEAFKSLWLPLMLGDY
jgi:hypothetical protein